MVQNNSLSFQDAGIIVEPEGLKVALINWQVEESCGVNHPQV